MHVTAFGLHRLEATAPWGIKQENQTEGQATPSDKKVSPTDLAHFAMLSRGNCWLSVVGIAEPIPLTGGDCFLVAKGASIVLRDSRWSFREIGANANGNVALCGGGGAPTTIVCGSLSFDHASLRSITTVFPSHFSFTVSPSRLGTAVILSVYADVPPELAVSSGTAVGLSTLRHMGQQLKEEAPRASSHRRGEARSGARL